MSATRLLNTASTNPFRTRIHQLTNSLRELPIDHANRRCLLATDGTSEIGRRRRMHNTHTSRDEQRYHFRQTVLRRIRRHDGEHQLSPPRGFTHLLHTDDGAARANAQAEHAKDALRDRRVHYCPRSFDSSVPPALSVSAVADSSPPSSVSSSMIVMSRSASSSVMPASLMKSSFSRSMMSFRVL